jgi:hypothetical protein
MPTVPQNAVGRVAAPDLARLGPVAWRHGDAKLPVWAGGAVERATVSGILVNEGKDNDCACLSRVALSLFALQQGALSGPKPATPPDFDFELLGAVGGRWVRLVGFQWNPATWDATGVLWWCGGLVEGFLLVGGSAGVGALESRCSVRWLADREGGAALGATATSDIVVVP